MGGGGGGGCMNTDMRMENIGYFCIIKLTQKVWSQYKSRNTCTGIVYIPVLGVLTEELLDINWL